MSLWYTPFREGLAYILAFVTIVLPVIAYRDYPAIFGDSPSVKLILITAIGGAISLAVGVQHGQRWLALVPGLLAGAGPAALYLAYLHFSGERPARLESIGLLAVGAAPGLLLMLVLRRLTVRRRQR